jgi:hypothetical protein
VETNRRSILRGLWNFLLLSLVGCNGDPAPERSASASNGAPRAAPSAAPPGPTGAVAELDVDLLEELASVVLPSELGSVRCKEVVREYVAWLRGYAPGVDLLSIEDSAFLSELPLVRAMKSAAVDPIARCADDLDGLDATSESKFGRRFAALERDEKAGIVRGVLEDSVRRMDLPPRNPVGDPALWLAGPAAFVGTASDHVALTLTAFYFNGPDAIRRCYAADLQPRTCRGFARVGLPPAPAPLREASSRPRSSPVKRALG